MTLRLGENWLGPIALILLLVGCKTVSSPASGIAPITQMKDANTPSGQYDRIMFREIGDRWYKLVGDRYREAAGNAKVQFLLHANGSVTDLRIEPENDDLPEEFLGFCRKAVLESAPFPAFPKELMGRWGKTRRVTIVFQYKID